MTPREQRRLELLDQIEARSRDIEQAKQLADEKKAELHKANNLLTKLKQALAELHHELLHGNPDMPIVQRIAEVQDAREAFDDEPDVAHVHREIRPEDWQRCLRHSLYDRDPNSAAIWSNRPSYMTEAEIMQMVRDTWPTAETWVPSTEIPGSKYGYTIQGGREPRIWMAGKSSHKAEPTASHLGLTGAIRGLLGIGERVETVEEKLDQALLHVLTKPPFGDAWKTSQWGGLDDEELLDQVAEMWPAGAAHLGYDDGLSGDGFTVVGGAGEPPELTLGSPSRDVDRDSPELLRGKALAERVRKVLGLEAPQMIDPDEPDVIRPWTGADLENALDDLIVWSGLAKWNRGLVASASDGVLRDKIRHMLPSMSARARDASECGGAFGYSARGGEKAAVWMEGSIEPDLVENDLVIEVRKALNREYPRPFDPKPKAIKPKARKAAAK